MRLVQIPGAGHMANMERPAEFNRVACRPSMSKFIADDFEDHQATAGRSIVTAREAQEVWDNGFLPRRNRRGASDTRLLIGGTKGGRRVTLVSRYLGGGIWLTYTAWDTKEADLV